MIQQIKWLIAFAAVGVATSICGCVSVQRSPYPSTWKPIPFMGGCDLSGTYRFKGDSVGVKNFYPLEAFFGTEPTTATHVRLANVSNNKLLASAMDDGNRIVVENTMDYSCSLGTVSVRIGNIDRKFNVASDGSLVEYYTTPMQCIPVLFLPACSSGDSWVRWPVFTPGAAVIPSTQPFAPKLNAPHSNAIN